jgi:hypothetical protein
VKKVFICSPLRGDVRGNIRRAESYCRTALLTHGALPIAPHVYFTRFLNDNDPAQRELGITAGLELLTGCDQLWIFDKTVTDGMKREIALAQSLGLLVITMDGENMNESKQNQKYMEGLIL